MLKTVVVRWPVQLSKRKYLTVIISGMLDSLFNLWVRQKTVLSTIRRWQSHICQAAGLLVVLILGGCALNSSSLSAPPQFLQSEIEKHPPAAGELTAYPLNGPFGGNITRLIRLGQSNTVIAGTDKGEFFRSEDAGASWSGASAKSHGKVNDIVMVDSLLLAATDDGIFRSNDGGKSWTQTQASFDAQPQPHVTNLVLFRDQLLAATNYGLFLSDRSGQSWLPIDSNSAPPIPEGRERNLALERNAVLVSDHHRLFSSNDLRSWQSAEKGLPLGGSPESEFVTLIKGGDVPFVYLIGEGGGIIYEKAKETGQWTAVPGVKNAFSIIASSNSLFVVTDGILRSRKNGQWVELGVPQRGVGVNDVVQLGETILAATTQGIYVRDGLTEAWTVSNDGLRSRRGPGTLLLDDDFPFRFAVSGATLFRSNGSSEDWRQISDEFEGWNFGEGPLGVWDVNSLDGWLFVTTNRGLYRGKLDGGPLTRLPPPKKMRNSTRSRSEDLARL